MNINLVKLSRSVWVKKSNCIGIKTMIDNDVYFAENQELFEEIRQFIIG